jgi:exodeoxyribonuclease V alpha subunit
MDDQISGSVDQVVFTNEDNGWTVARLNRRRGEEEGVCIVGHFPRLKAGEVISCKGRWTHHASHGRQFEVSAFELALPKDLVGIQKYLESGNVKGIGPVNAKRIVEKFGIHTLDVMNNEPERLSEVEGIGKKRVEMIVEHWETEAALRDIMIFLRGHGIGAGLAAKIHKRYGESTITVLKENPYLVARDIFGVGFKTADKIAEEIGIPLDSPVRVHAGLEFILRGLSEEGHTCYPEEDLIALTEKTLEVTLTTIHSAIVALEREDRIIRRELTVEEVPKLFVWLRSLFIGERGISKQFDRIKYGKCHIRPVKCDKALEWVQEKQHIKLAKEQMAALQRSLEEKVHIITGGPGTGKSTITKAILAIHEKLSDKILLAAPTGKAAKRLSEITRRRASTIHSLLEYDFTTMQFKKNLDNPLKCDLIIIDEASMIDTYLMHSLLRAIPDEARVILIGDVDQLPSIGPGNVLRDCIESGAISITRLFQIFRQGKDSLITLNAHNINKGIFPEIVAPKGKSDFLFFPIEESQDILAKMLLLVQETLPKEHRFHPLKDIQILSPMRKGVIGIENLNVILQEKINPGKKKIVRFGREFRVGDKVMQIRNNYTKVIYNGDVGFIQDIDLEESLVTVSFDDKLLEYEATELDELTLAYAVSVHKYQGSECPCIIIPIHMSHYKLLQRNLLYTAITRGKKLVILLGTQKAIHLAVQNNEVRKRHTGLSYFLAEN